MNLFKGNKGEWSEVYVLLKLLSEGYVYIGDDNLNKIDDTYFSILDIYRNETSEQKNRYSIDEEVVIFVNDQEKTRLSKKQFSKYADILLRELTKKENKGAFSVPTLSDFLENIYCSRLSARSNEKADIILKLLERRTGLNSIEGFSIKSELGSSSTLLNAGRTTNFSFLIKSDMENHTLCKATNEIVKTTNKQSVDLKGRMEYIKNNGEIVFSHMNNIVFSNNLELIDTSMKEIISETLLYFYLDGITSCWDMVEKLKETNPLNYGNLNAYAYKFKKFLTAIALGMRPATEWNGIEEANGGYLVVKKTGEILGIHIYQRNYFENYLLKHTKYEVASTSRHKFGSVYINDGQVYIDLNLQIRFKNFK